MKQKNTLTHQYLSYGPELVGALKASNRLLIRQTVDSLEKWEEPDWTIEEQTQRNNALLAKIYGDET